MTKQQVLLDYSHYVEVVDEEECACFRRWVRGMDKFEDEIGVPAQGPLRFLNRDLGSQIVNYEEERLRLFESFGGDSYCTKCPYCKSQLNIVHECNRDYNDVFGKIFVSVCHNCGWWESSDECIIEHGEENWYRAREIRRRGLLREFSVGGCELPLETLRSYIRKRPDILRDIHPKKLEQLVGAVFGEFMNCEAINLGGPNDGGVDLILINGEHRYVFQVKRRASSKKAESVVGIREFLGAMLLKREMKGIFVSTAPRFSRHANLAAREIKNRKLVDYIKLVNAKKLIDVCDITIKNVPRPWDKFATTPADPPPEFPQTYFLFSVRG